MDHRNLKMLLHWSAELVNRSLAGLTVKERAALDLLSSIPTATKLGTARLKQFGFKDMNDYATALESARMHVKRHLAVMGIHHIHDLDFVEPGTSVDGKIQKQARTKVQNELRGNARADTPGDC